MHRRLQIPILLAAALATACSSEAAGTEAGSANADTAADHTTSSRPDESNDETTDEKTMDDTFYSGTVTTLEGDTVDLADYAGKVTLVVNVASQCGFTPQYEGLQKLHEELGGPDSDFAILAFPSNDFGGQEPGSAAEIREFCTSKYDVGFTMLDKTVVKQPGDPVYDRLAAMADGQRPTWNFCKYVVGKDGKTAKFFASRVAPESDELRGAIAAMR